MRFAVVEPPRTGAYCTLHTLYPLKRCSWRRFGPVEPSRTCVKEVYIPCYLYGNVVREGSMRFDVLENVVREGLMRFDVLEPHPTSA